MHRDHDMLSCLLRIVYLHAHSIYHEMWGHGFRLTLRRLLILIVTCPILCSLVVWNHLGFLLDDILFPHWKDVEVSSVMFIVGNARSGTTWLHRLICDCDASSFTSLRTWEILFAASITWRYLFHSLYSIDCKYLHGSAYHFLRALDRYYFGHIQIHPVGLFEHEEDEWLMMHIGVCQLLLLIFPGASEYLSKLVNFDCCASYLADSDEALSNAVQRVLAHPVRQGNILAPEEASLSVPARLSLLSYYRQCVKKHLYYYTEVAGHSPHQSQERSNSDAIKSRRKLVFISKNPAFTLRIESLYRIFPEAYVVCMVRDPVKSVPSMVSYISKVWHVFASPCEQYPNVHTLLNFCKAHYLFPLLHIPIHPSSPWYNKRRGCFISYEKMRGDVKGEVLQLLCRILLPHGRTENEAEDEMKKFCSWIDWERVDMFLEREMVKTSRYVSGHECDLSTCCAGMTEKELMDSLKAVYGAHKGTLSEK